MKLMHTPRGFEILVMNEPAGGLEVMDRVVQQSSTIGPYPDAAEKPGSSLLWLGGRHCLNREQVGELVERLQAWLKTGSLEIKEKECNSD